LGFDMDYKSVVLIVDDDPNARDTLEALLFQEGYSLAFASDGVEALAKAAELTPDLILLDVMMPGLDGFEVCQRLRADPLLAEVPVIMITALDDRGSRLRGIEVGADDFISKPLDGVELQARVRTVIQLNRYRRLLLERAKFEWVVEQARDGYLIVDDSDRVLYANPQARLYLGFPSASSEQALPVSRRAELAGASGLTLPADEGEIISRRFLELARRQYHCRPEESWAVWPVNAGGTLASPQVPRYLVRPESPTANALWLRVDLMEMSSGEAGRLLIRLRDVTSDISTRNSMWTFHAFVSHKLRTSLVQLTGFLELLRRNLSTLSEAQIQANLSTAHGGAIRLRDEIQDIFEYVRATGIVQPGQGQCDLGEIASVISEVNADLEIQSIHVSYGGLEDLDGISVPLSRHAIKLILWELLENAKKFHPAQSPAVEVKVSGIADGVRIRVCDDGLTLAPDQLAQVWMPYFQAEKDFTGQIPGMGLGLSVVASLVWGVGGTCRLYNREEGPGVIVELVLPLSGREEGG